MADDRFLALLEPRKDEVRELLGTALDDEKQRFIALAIRAVQDPKFDKCTPESKIGCIIQAAACKLELGTVPQLAFLVPYSGELTFQPSYIGQIKLAIDASIATDIYADLVYEHDEITVESGTDRRLIHKPKIFGERGKLIGAYAVAKLPDGGNTFEILEMKDIEAIKAAALRIAERGGQSKGLSPAWRFFEGEMVKKSAIRRLVKRLQGKGSPEAMDRLRKGIERDDLDFEAMRGAEKADDDMPTAARKVHAEVVDDKANGSAKRHSSAAKKPDPQKDRPVTMSEANELSETADSLNLGFKMIQGVLKKYGVEEFEALKVSQVAGVAEALAAAAAQ